MELYIFRVNNFQFTGTEPFGEPWKQAKEKAAEVHAPIYRTHIKVNEDVYCEGGIMLDVKYASQKDIKIF